MSFVNKPSLIPTAKSFLQPEELVSQANPIKTARKTLPENSSKRDEIKILTTLKRTKGQAPLLNEQQSKKLTKINLLNG